MFPFGQTWIDRYQHWLNQRVEFRRRSIVLSSLITTALLTVCQTLRITEPLELFVFDQGIRLIADQPMDERLLIVGLTDQDIATYGWPLPEDVLAQVLANLQQHQPRVVGLDFYRSVVESPALKTQFAATNLIAVTNVGEDEDTNLALTTTAIPWERSGFSDLIIDRDSVVRRSLLFVGTPSPTEPPFYSFALRSALQYLEPTGVDFQVDAQSFWLDDRQIPILEKGDGGYQNIDDGGYQILLRYRDRLSPAPQITISEVLKQSFDPALVRDKIVLIGSTNSSLKDIFYTPYSAGQEQDFLMPGVVVHAQIISQILDIATASSSTFFRFIPIWLEPAVLFFWATIAGIITWRINRPIVLLISTGIVVLTTLVISYSLLHVLIWLPVVDSIIGLLLAVGLGTGQRLLYQSTYDELTHLPKRDLFVNLVQKAIHRHQTHPESLPVIVAFLDIERINLINKSLGYQAGDRILKSVAERLEGYLPNTTQVARIGDSEFAILFKQSTQSTVQAILEQLHEILSKPFALDDHRLLLHPSLGISMTQEYESYSPDHLIRDAHLAMYQSKASLQVKQTVFSHSMLTADVDRLQLESALLTAIEEEQFELAYQPIVCLQTGRIAGFEALIRWPQTDGSLISPVKFIPIAEETGLILPLGAWVFKSACQQLHHWREQFASHNLVMSINLSSRQFSQPDLIDMIRDTLKQLNLQGQDIRLEITESMVMDDIRQSINLMMQFRELGIQLGIDDFGTGYSSLSYLHRLPLDTIKVDKSFVGRMESNREDHAIVNTILNLGHSLQMNIVAEGVETAAQVRLLQEARCQYGQGYFFARPLPAAKATQLLDAPSWSIQAQGTT